MNKPGIIGFTAIETAFVIIWRVLIRQAQAILGAGLLAIGFVLEHFVAHRVLVGGEAPRVKLIGISGSEAVIWIAWLVLVQINVLLGSAFFFIAMWAQHGVERNVFTDRPVFEKLFKVETLGFTGVETLAAGLWFVATEAGQIGVGNVILFTGFLTEHFMQANLKAKNV